MFGSGPPSIDLASVAAWAAAVHAGQTYGDGRPYTVHLHAVDEVLVRFGFSDPRHPHHQALRVAAQCHDTVEDAGVDPADLLARYGAEVMDLVVAVTNEPGPNRAARHAATYPKTRAAGPWAVVLKVADRIANLEASVGTRYAKMYLAEHAAFRKALYRPGEPSEAMWAHLDALVLRLEGKG